MAELLSPLPSSWWNISITVELKLVKVDLLFIFVPAIYYVSL
jgi:hypothetical protein